MEKDKYYIPEIEELHVGFECEFTQFAGPGLPNTWGKMIINSNILSQHQVGNMETFLATDCIRVKYLDREDVKSLGFGIDQRGDWSKRFGDTDIYISFHTGPERPIWVEITKENGDMLFDGQLKNKSELKRILKQIGYGE